MTKAKKEEATASTEVVSYLDQMAAEAKSVAKSERVSADRFTTASGILSYMGNPMPDNQMDVVVLASAQENVYYAGTYDADNITPPDCFALAEPGQALAPHEDVPEPISLQCQNCGFMQFKSAPNKKGKACKEKRRLACIPLSDEFDGEMAMLTVPVMSVKNWSVYVNTISAKYQRPSWGMITRIKIVPDPKSQFRILFAEVEPVDSEQLGLVNARVEAAKQMLMTPYDMNREPREEENKKY